MEAPLPDALVCTIEGPLTDALLCTIERPLLEAFACTKERPPRDILVRTTTRPLLDVLVCTNKERVFETFAAFRFINRNMGGIGCVKAVFLTIDLTCTRSMPFERVSPACADDSAVCL